MKKILTILAIVLLCSCQELFTAEVETTKWIEKAEKPIICIKSEYYSELGYSRYTLISKNGKTYFTGGIRFSLPDTIR